MKNIYFVQINDVYKNGTRKNTYLPYAVGCIEAYCLANEFIASEYRFGKIIYNRDDIPALVRRMTDPYMVLFSCSVWNTEFNKALAKAVKRAHPECLVTFGGHHVSGDVGYLEKYDFIDFMTHRDGEEPTAALLESLARGGGLAGVPNLSYRDPDGKIVTTRYEQQTGTDYPSPYLTGIFDDILQDDVEFSMLFETNRGCPNACSYCDWGTLKAKVRLFPMERVLAEINWFVEHKTDYIYCTDANFCLFSRDAEIVDYIIACSKKYGYPKFFHVNFTKNRQDFVFDVSSRMVKSGLSKAQTIAFQSLNEEVLRNIGRKNISADHFRSLMTRFRENSVATYSELILGLPGETYRSFCDGICSLLENGQHYAINVYPCELLPNSEMGQAYYRRRYRLESTYVPFLLMHSTLSEEDHPITEYAEYVTSTYSMTKDDWARSLLFASYIQGLHNLGMLRAVAIFCRYRLDFDYASFYQALIDESAAHPDTQAGRLYAYIEQLCRGVIDGRNPFVQGYDDTDNILWGFDELVFLEAYRHARQFYAEVRTWLERRFGKDALLDALFDYQEAILKEINVADVEIRADYDFYTYFDRIIRNDPQPLQKKKIRLRIHDDAPVASFAQFARHVVWYGRNRQESDYTSSHYRVICETEDDEDSR